MPEDDYPTKEELETIRKWPIANQSDAGEWLAYVKSVWWNPEWGWSEEDREKDDMSWKPYRLYRVSTAGWSGNESIIGAMMDNRWLWFACWHSTRRGGHYEFRVEHDR